MSPARLRFYYDVFVSYSHYDKDWVRSWLMLQLRSAGLTICIDYTSFEVGAPSVSEIERAVVQSRKTVCILTPAYLQSEWTTFEHILVQTLDPAAHARRLLPALLYPCELPLRLQALTHVDFTHAAEQEEQLKRLIAAISRRPATPRTHVAGPTVPLIFEVPTGALPPNSPLYIERSHDHVMRRQVTHTGSTTIIEGARQMGKSSLLASG